MLTLFACPPLMPRTNTDPITVSRQEFKPSTLMTSSTLSLRSSAVVFFGSFSAAVYASICATVNSSTSVSNCSTYPTMLLRSEDVGFLPLMRIVPSILPPVLRPESTSRRVLFPLPLGPMRAVILPATNEPLRPFNILSVPSGAVFTGTEYITFSKTTFTPPLPLLIWCLVLSCVRVVSMPILFVLMYAYLLCCSQNTPKVYRAFYGLSAMNQISDDAVVLRNPSESGSKCFMAGSDSE
mmetsp:Transcript_9061/g.12546  ORF Transcript_9061/g.12546 Transcript_9061/m.12546 type:complete len:239 (-) Transcript_9061:26-742(-)